MMRLFQLFRKSRPTITYGITVCNEVRELEELLDYLLKHIDLDDQIIILQDITKPHEGIYDIIKRYEGKVLHLTARLNGDFSAFKNNLLSHAVCDYLFQIDADEIPSESLLENLKPLLIKNRKKDCFRIPRINIVHGITDEHIAKWNWKQNKNGYINFPDFQMRLFRLKTKKKIHWINKVHEVLTGYKRVMNLPIEDYRFCLFHEKQIDRQEKQNDFYDKMI